MAKETINVNELQSKISTVLKQAQNGTVFEVMRYSEPIAVVLSYDEFLKMRGECHKCVQDLRKIAGDIKKK